MHSCAALRTPPLPVQSALSLFLHLAEGELSPGRCRQEQLQRVF